MAKSKLTPEEKRAHRRVANKNWRDKNPDRHRKARARDPQRIRAQERAAKKRCWEKDPEKMRANARVRSGRWRERHPERIAEVRRRTRVKHIDEWRARYRAWAAVNREKRRLTAKKWFDAHPDRVLAANRKNYARNRDRKEFKDQQRQYKREHLAEPASRLSWLVSCAKRRAKTLGRNFDESLFAMLTAAPPVACASCHAALDYSSGKGRGPRSPSLDRVDNSEGYTADNVAVICDRCNNIKGTATIERLLIRCDGMKRGTLRNHPAVASTIEEIENVIAYMRAHQRPSEG
jgi:hypothetical protein